MPSLETALREIMSGRMPEGEVSSFLTTLRDRGETVEEVTAAASVMREFAVKSGWSLEEGVDTCGTGGDQKGTFNISTAAAFVVAGAGVKVAKHGNRSVSSQCGSADLLEALGVKIDLPPESVKKCVDDTGIGFFFAPRYHPAMKNVAAVRKKIGTRTIFNLLGPLLNPAGVRHQVIGVFDQKWIEPMARVAARLGSSHVLVVHGEDGLDEITLTGPTTVAEFKNERVIHPKISTFVVQPEDFGFKLCSLEDLRGGDAKENASTLKAVLEGLEGPIRDVVILNAAAALVAVGRAEDWHQGVLLAKRSLDHGTALNCLQKMVEVSNRDS
ncbi:MAG: anthranilate phosphoribosyltransferase [Deltaproteobacteria bacterium]|nr:anthranilate phosphoribosyltransferase [Deltaproteobacteria bacterium]